MHLRLSCSALLLTCISVSSLLAADPKAVALDAISMLFIEKDPAGFADMLAEGAVQGDRGPGSAAEKLAKQTPEMLESVQVRQIIFFGKDEIAPLRTSYPDDLWERVESHIGDRQGVLVQLALSGELAERARAAGKDPRNVAMMTFVLSDKEDPKIVHVDDN